MVFDAGIRFEGDVSDAIGGHEVRRNRRCQWYWRGDGPDALRCGRRAGHVFWIVIWLPPWRWLKSWGVSTLHWSWMCSAFEAAVEQAAADDRMAGWESVDVLVNNAGSELNKTYNETTVEEWDKVLDTDLNGTLAAVQAFSVPPVHGGAWLG